MTKQSKYGGAPVQTYAFGGIANPSQRAFLRSSDQAYLDARQKELDEFEKQRVAYNDSLTKWQNEVYNPYKAQVDAYNAASAKYNTDIYNPYKAQVDAYNAAAEKYNTEVYNPYKTEFDKYKEAVDAWNAGDRTTDYAGPAEPKLASEFTMAAPTQPKAFDMATPTTPEDFKGVAPVLPFKEEEVKAQQQAAAGRARQDASNRAVAIDVASNPDQFNFGSMSVSHRFMAKGGEVKDKSAKEMLGEMDGGYKPSDAEILKMVHEVSSKGKLSHEQIMQAVDRVAAAGRGGDELLAYLSPQSVQLLKKMGGAGTINPATGLHEFKGGFLANLVRSVKEVFSPSKAAPAAAEAVPAPAALPRNENLKLAYEDTGPTGDESSDRFVGPRQPVPTTAAQDLKYLFDKDKNMITDNTGKYITGGFGNEGMARSMLDAFNKGDASLNDKGDVVYKSNPWKGEGYRIVPSLYRENQYHLVTPEGQIAATGDDKEMLTSWMNQKNGVSPISQPVIGTTTDDTFKARPTDQVPGMSDTGTTKAPASLTPTPVTLAPADEKIYTPTQPSIYTPKEPTIATPDRPPVDRKVDDTFWTSKTQPTPTPAVTPAPVTPTPAVLTPKDRITPTTPVGTGAGSSPVGGGPVSTVSTYQPNISFTPLQAASPLAKVDLKGTVTSPTSGRTGSGTGSRTTARGPDNSSVGGIPIYQSPIPDYSSRGVGSVGPVGSSTNIPIFGPTASTGPLFTDMPINRGGGAAGNPNNYFAMTPQNSTGLAPGSAAIGPADLPIAAGRNTLGAIGANPNLSPTMLGGVQNAGIMTDRLGNRIYSPGMGPLFGFAKGGGVDLSSLAEMNASNLSDEQPEETINTNPVGSAQQMLSDINSLGQTQYDISPTRQSIKRTRVTPVSGEGGAKGMKMEYESLTKGDLSAMKDFKPAIRDTDSAKAQMEELARVYKLKIRAAENKGKGLMADTMGAPTLEQPTLTKGSLTKKRFEKGGEAKKAGAESVEEPSIFGVSDYATKASARMYPDQLGQDDERDAARHMLAAATVARKFGPGTAQFLGKAHERMSNPESFFSMFGIGKPREDYEMDVHNNKIGADLAARATSQAELEKLVQAMARESRTKQTEGKPWTMSREQMQNRKGQVMTPPPEYRADGTPEEGEIGPAFVTPKSGKGRKEGEISRQLKSGEAYTNMAKGVTELPYDLAGAPVDLATMLMRPFGYSTEKPVMSSDWIKEKMTGAGVRPEPPADPTAKGFYTAGEMLSNMVNPAGVARKAGPVVEKGVKAGAMEVGRQLDRAILDNAGPLAKAVPQAAKPLYAVRPTGSTVLSGPVGMEQNVSKIDQLLNSGISNAKSAAGQDQAQEAILQNFWDKKARNYFTRQFGTPDDPIATAISKKQIKGSALDEMFPEYLIDQIGVGKTRVNEQGQERFFPKYPRAMEDFTSRYDKATGLKGSLITTDPAAANPKYSSLLSEEGRLQGMLAETAEQDKMLAQGMRPELINTDVGAVTRSAVDPTKIIGDGAESAKALFNAYEEANKFKQMPEPEKTGWINKIFGEGRRILGKNEQEVGQNLLPENVRTAIAKGEPVYDVDFMRAPLTELFDARSINRYLASIPPREAANIRFEDAVKGALKMKDKATEMENVVSRIKSGKPVADAVFSKGVSGPLLQVKEGPLEGYAWKRIEKREATVPEGAYVGHSVGGYETGGATYTQDKREGFNTGKWQVYTLRDNRNRPVNTIEVKMLDEDTPVVTQIKGNGRATGNTAPEKYDTAVLDFLQNYLKPAAIEESDSYLTPLLQSYKGQLGPSPRTR